MDESIGGNGRRILDNSSDSTYSPGATRDYGGKLIFIMLQKIMYAVIPIQNSEYKKGN